MADIFVSYTSSDREWAFWIGQQLEKLGHVAHIHEWEIDAGGNIPAWMQERQDNADHTLCVISNAYLSRPYSSWELQAAQWAAASEKPNFMLPLFVEDCKAPTMLAPFKRCDLFGLNENEARERLETYLKPAAKPSESARFPGGGEKAPLRHPEVAVFPGSQSKLSNTPTSTRKPSLGRDDSLMGSLWSPGNRNTLSWLGGGAVVVITGLWAAFVYFFPPKKDGEGPRPQVKIESSVKAGDYREQRDCDRQHGELRPSASRSVAKTMTRAAVLAAVALSAAIIAFGQQAAVALGDTKVEAGSCAIANTGSASFNTINCNFGLTPEQFKQVTEAAIKGAIGAQQEHFDKISETLGVTKSATKTLLTIVGEDPNIPDDKLAEALTRAAGDYKRLQAQVAALNPDNPEARKLVDQAKPEIEAGHFQRAHDLLRQATQAQIAAAQEARKLREQAQAAEDAQMLGAASSTAAEGDVALTERRYAEAAELFGQAAGYVPGGHAGERGGYLLRQANALYREGEERGDNAALRGAIEVCGRALLDYPRARAPLDWAGTQMNLGNALWRLGERESGTAPPRDRPPPPPPAAGGIYARAGSARLGDD